MREEYPFPDQQSSFRILRRDPVFAKIEEGDVQRVFDDAWQCGTDAATGFIRKYCSLTVFDMVDVFHSYGFTIQYFNYDYVVGHQRYFCEYTAKKKRISVYKKSVEMWAENNGFSYERGLNLILSHEFYHYLEATELGYTSRRYLVPMIILGKLRLGKTGVPALSEIAANAFANYCYNHFLCLRGEE